MTVFTVPTIDVSPYFVPGADSSGSAECAGVAREIDRACREVGFFQVVGHRVPESAVDGLAAALDEFFGLPLEVKKAYRRGPETNRGYAPPRSESLSMSLGLPAASQMNDFFEAFTVGTETTSYPGHELPESSYGTNTWPAATPGFRPAVEDYIGEVTSFSRLLLAALSDALGLSRGYFDALTDYSIDALKLNNYALEEGEIELAGELVGMGEHTDFGILTVLWADRVAGLQVLGQDARWHDVQPAEGAFLVNLGDAMARWTSDRWMSTLHRVVPLVVDGRIVRRRSAAFFFDGNFDAVIEPLPGCVSPGQETYAPITVAENINAKLAGFKTGKAPAIAGREAARALAAR